MITGQTITCSIAGTTFTFGVRDQEFFASKVLLMNLSVAHLAALPRSRAPAADTVHPPTADVSRKMPTCGKTPKYLLHPVVKTGLLFRFVIAKTKPNKKILINLG